MGMDANRIAELREWHKATTQGDWETVPTGELGEYQLVSPEVGIFGITAGDFADEDNANADFIANSHNAWIELLDEIERLATVEKEFHSHAGFLFAHGMLKQT
jgi:hypothetical protein